MTRLFILITFLLLYQPTYSQERYKLSEIQNKEQEVQYKDCIIIDIPFNRLFLIDGKNTKIPIVKNELFEIDIDIFGLNISDDAITFKNSSNVVNLKNDDQFKFFDELTKKEYSFVYKNPDSEKEESKVIHLQADSKENQPITDDGLNKSSKINFVIGQNILNDAKILINRRVDDDEKKKVFVTYKTDNEQPFLVHAKLGSSNHSTGNIRGNKFSNIAKTDVTNFATGMARFLADRAKAEMNESFFIQMHKQMEKMPELQLYFPESYLFLKRLDAQTMSFDLEYLKSKFETDIKFLPRNILTTISIANDDNYPYFKTANTYLNNNINGLWMNIALRSVMESNGNINPKDLLYHFVHAKNDNSDTLLFLQLEKKLSNYKDQRQVNLINSIKLAELISNSLLSPETGKFWVNRNDINELINDEKLFQTYIGLVLAKSDFKEYEISFNGKKLKEIVENNYAPGKKVNEDLSNLKNLIQGIYQTYQNIEDQINIVKKTSNERELVENSYEAFSVVKSSVFTIQNLISKNNYLEPQGININTDVFTNYIDPSVEVAYNLFNKKYNLAIKNFIVVLNQVPTASKFMSDYDLVNLVENIDIDNLKELNGQKVINTFLQQKNIKASLVKTQIFNENDITEIIKNNSISKTDLLKLATSKEKEMNNYLANNKAVQDYFNTQSKDYNKFISKFSTYGTLIANVAVAQNSDEVKAAIEASVLPVGSSRIKRSSHWSIALNAYVGGFAGKAHYKENIDGVHTNHSIHTFGITAPIGVSFNKGKIPFFSSNSALGLNLQLIDLGSLVNFYAQKGDGAQLPNNTKIELGDIIAPGGFLSYSLGDTPFTLLGGMQYVPNLSRLKSISTNDDFRPLTWRVHVGIGIDIPLFNLKVWN